jgi:hypothetical protein
MHTKSVTLLIVVCIHSAFALYDEKLARERFLPLASAAYSKSPENCVQNVFSDATVSFFSILPILRYL